MTGLRTPVRHSDAVVRGAIEALEGLRDGIARRLEKAEGGERGPVIDEMELELHAIVCELREVAMSQRQNPTPSNGEVWDPPGR